MPEDDDNHLKLDKMKNQPSTSQPSGWQIQLHAHTPLTSLISEAKINRELGPQHTLTTGRSPVVGVHDGVLVVVDFQLARARACTHTHEVTIAFLLPNTLSNQKSRPRAGACVRFTWSRHNYGGPSREEALGPARTEAHQKQLPAPLGAVRQNTTRPTTLAIDYH